MSWDERDVTLLKELWALIAPEAWAQAASSKAQNKTSPEAKTGVVGRLCQPGGKEGIETAGEAAAQ